jgi:hypothetical protein
MTLLIRILTIMLLLAGGTLTTLAPHPAYARRGA